MKKLLVTPSQNGYSVDDGNEVLSVALSGGPSRRRRDFIGAVSLVNVTWNLPPNDFNYLKAFYRTAIEMGSDPFLVDLVLDGYSLSEYQATFVPGSWRLTGVAGTETSVSAQLEVRPNAADVDSDDGLILLYEDYGSDAEFILGALAELVNVDLYPAVGG